MVISLPTGNDDPAHVLSLSKELTVLLRQASTYHGYDGSNSHRPALELDLYQDRVFHETEMPPRCAGNYDLGTLYTKYGICDLVAAGKVDEVWFWDGGQGGLPEWATHGPEWSSIQGTNMPSCGRQSALMVFNNRLDLGYALHSFGHRMETTFMNYFKCDFTTRTWPWTDWGDYCGAAASDRTGFVARPFAGNGNIAACGDIHHPPNIGQADGEYVYDSPRSVKSICATWRRDGAATASNVSCATWGCTQQGFVIWWMQNVPGPDNVNRDAAGRPYANWWPYLFGRPSAAAAPTAGLSTATATGTPDLRATPSATPSPRSTGDDILSPTVPPLPTSTPTETPAVHVTMTATLTRTMTPLPGRLFVPIGLAAVELRAP